MDWTVFGMFLAAGLMVAADPGPTELQIFSQSINGDALYPASLIASAVFANALMVLATVAGLSALIVASQSALTLLR